MSDERRIVIFSANHLPNIGGVERFTDGISQALAHLGFSVTIVTNNTFGLANYEQLSEYIDIIRLPCHPLIGGRFPLPKCSRETLTLFRSLEHKSCEGVLINTRFYVHTLLGLEYARRVGIRPIVLDHGSDYLTFGNKILDFFVRLYEHSITSVVKWCNPEFYGISEKSVEWLRTFGISAKGIISNSIDASAYRSQASGRSFRKEFNISPNGLLIAFTGRLIPEKGIGTLIEIMSALVNCAVELIVAGDGPLYCRMQEIGLPNVHLVGRLDQPDIAALLLESDLFLLPSRSEGFCTSLLEAASCGTPFLVTDVGGARELAPDQTYGYIMPSRDSGDFVDVIRRVSNERYELKQMGKRCRLQVEENYSWNAVAIKLIEALNIPM